MKPKRMRRFRVYDGDRFIGIVRATRSSEAHELVRHMQSSLGGVRRSAESLGKRVVVRRIG